MGQINKYADLYSRLTPELPACPEPLMLQAIQKKTRQFCQDTDAWREQLTDMNLAAGVLNYALNSGFGAEIRNVHEVRINTAANRAEGYRGSVVDRARYVFHVEQTREAGVAIPAGTLRLDSSLEPAEDVTGGLEVCVSLAPWPNAMLIDGDFFRRYQEAIIGGVLFFLMTMKGRKWTDPERAVLFLADYNRGVSRARRMNVDGAKGGGSGLSA